MADERDRPTIRRRSGARLPGRKPGPRSRAPKRDNLLAAASLIGSTTKPPSSLHFYARFLIQASRSLGVPIEAVLARWRTGTVAQRRRVAALEREGSSLAWLRARATPSAVGQAPPVADRP